eukprot:2080600-Prymnesium_polylepis.2
MLATTPVTGCHTCLQKSRGQCQSCSCRKCSPRAATHVTPGTAVTLYSKSSSNQPRNTDDVQVRRPRGSDYSFWLSTPCNLDAVHAMVCAVLIPYDWPGWHTSTPQS